jgi:hypothetical protein
MMSVSWDGLADTALAESSRIAERQGLNELLNVASALDVAVYGLRHAIVGSLRPGCEFDSNQSTLSKVESSG